jgi:hypothetical protein
MTGRGVTVPADVDLADKVLWGLTIRQVALLAPVALGLLAVWRVLLGHVPILALLIATAPIAAVALALALVRVDGVGLDRLAWAALRGRRGRVVPGEAEPTAVVAASRLTGRAVRAGRAMRSPVRGVSADGVIEVGPHGFAVALDVGFVNFTLRSPSEQASLVAAFARLLNSVDCHLQVIVSARPVDLSGYLAALGARCAALESGPLAEAGHAHREWMGRLTTGRSLLRREITVVVTAAHPDGADYAARQVESTAQSLGVEALRLDGAEVAARCRYAIDPFGTASARIAAVGKETGHGTRSHQ